MAIKMLSREKLKTDYFANAAKPLFFVADTSFLLQSLFSLKKTKGSNSDLSMLNLLSSFGNNISFITILTKSVVQEFLNLPVPCSLEQIFNIENGVIKSTKLDTERFKIRHKFLDSHDDKPAKEITIDFSRYKKRINWLKDFINENKILILDTKLDQLYLNDVKNIIKDYNPDFKNSSNQELVELFISSTSAKLAEKLTKLLISKKVRKDIGEVSGAFAVLELQKLLGQDTPARFTFAYNGNDDRGWFIETYQTFKEYYFNNVDITNLKYSDFKRGRLYPEDKYNPNSAKYNKQLSSEGLTDKIKVSFLTTNGFRRILGEIFASFSTEQGKRFLFSIDENENGKLDLDKFSNYINEAQNNAILSLGSSYSKFYKKYKDVSIQDSSGANNEMSFKTGQAGPFEFFCKKNIEAMEVIAKEHTERMIKYYLERGTILQQESIKILTKYKGLE
jgi:hypothetical protein